MQSRTSRTLLVFVLLAAAPAVAWCQGESPPMIDPNEVIWQIRRFVGTGYGPLTPFTPGNALDVYVGGYASGADIAHELDLIYITVNFSDQDLDPAQETEGEKFFYRKRSTWCFDPPLPPDPTPVPGDTSGYEPLVNAQIDLAAQTGAFTLSFQVPAWSGVSQERLRDPTGHPYDVGWCVDIRLANDKDPENQDGRAWAEVFYVLFAVKNPANVEPNPPAIADAGSNQIVAVGAAVTLDAGQSFDGSNVGFDPLDPQVFLKDNLIVTWEWVSGPVRVEPIPDSVDPFLAKVTLATRGTYVFRVMVADGVNPIPSSDLVTIEVVNADELPSANLPPIAIIAQPQPVVVGSAVILDGRNSWDPNPDDANHLEFRWQQTNEIGDALTQDELQAAFQPLSGLRSSSDPNSSLYGADTWGRSTWRSVTTGTFYFRLLVSDPLGGTASDMVAVQVVEATAGETATRDAAAGATNGTSNPTAVPACGGGLLPLAMVPVVLMLVRRRR